MIKAADNGKLILGMLALVRTATGVACEGILQLEATSTEVNNVSSLGLVSQAMDIPNGKYSDKYECK